MDGQEFFDISPSKPNILQEPSPSVSLLSWANNDNPYQQNENRENGVSSPTVPAQRNFYESTINGTSELSGATGLLEGSSHLAIRYKSMTMV